MRNLHDIFSFAAISFAQQGEDLVLERILSRKIGLDLDSYQGIYVDAGAFHPVSHSTTRLLYLRGWRGICIDISEESCAMIRRRRPRDIVLNLATSDREEVLHFAGSGGISLINKAEAATGEEAGGRKVQARSLTRILEDAGIEGEIDYLNIDTEGAELKTLQGLDFPRHRPKVISVEIHCRDLRAMLETDVARFLEAAGYDCVGGTVITWFFMRRDLHR